MIDNKTVAEQAGEFNKAWNECKNVIITELRKTFIGKFIAWCLDR